jgi:hypothetical protein
LSAPIIPTPTTTSSSTTTTPTAPPVTVPIDLAGKSADAVGQQLKSLGFTAIKYVDNAGNMVAASTTWIVESVDGAGTGMAQDGTVTVHVAQPPPPPAPATPKPAPPKPVTPKAATPKPAPPPPPAPQAAGYYANCTAARAAGVTPLHRGDPGYRAGLDRDNDGVACE